MSDPTPSPEHRSRAHQDLREMLGALALGHLSPDDRARAGVHVRDCADRAAELAEISPVAELLGLVDADRFASPPSPPRDLGDRIVEHVSQERAARAEILEVQRLSDAEERRRRRRRSRLRWAAVAAGAVLVAGVLGGLAGPLTAPAPTAVPVEPIELKVGIGQDLEIESADLVDHSWGTELRLVAAGFADGRTYRAWFRTEDGEMVPAGEFLGVGDAEMTCFLQSAAPRDDVTEVMVTDPSGTTVLSSSLPP